MKKTMKSFLALAVCAMAMGFASCSSDDDENGTANDGNKEYLFAAGCHISEVEGDETGEIKEQQQEIVAAALEKAGFAGEAEYPLSISGKDSAAVSKVLLEKMAQVEKAIKDAPFEINAELSVRGAEKSVVNSEDKEVRNIMTWYEKSFGTPSNNSVNYKRISNNNGRKFVKWLRTRGSHFSEHQGDYWTEICYDLNKDAGGDYIYLVFEHSGKGNDNYRWESQFENSYITDVIAVTGGGEPQTLYVNGRKYTKENEVCDLNKGAGGDYIWLYATREKYKETDGKYYYLTTGRSDYDYAKYNGTCIWSSTENFNASSNCENKIVNGHMTRDRIVVLYDTKGNFVDSEAELNRNAEGKFIKLMLTYATKEAGY